jgi:peptidyl-dipeptidase Dcp
MATPALPSVLHDAPDWAKLTPEVHRRRLEKALKKAKRRQEQLSENPLPATFQNTIVTLERINDIVRKAWEPFSMATTFNSTDDMMALQEEMAEPFSDFEQELYQDARIWKRVQTVHASWAAESLPRDESWLLEQTRRAFMESGAHLPTKTQRQLKAWHGELAKKQVQFGKALLAATQEPFWVTDANALQGVKPELIQEAAERADELGRPGQWAMGVGMTNVRAVLETSTNPAFRQALWTAHTSRGKGGPNDTTELTRDILRLRSKIARTMGFENWAAFSLQDEMAGTPAAAEGLLRQVWPHAKAQYEREAEQLRQAQGGQPVRAADWFYLASQVKQTQYAFDDQVMRDYLPRDRVRQGLFDVTHKLFGVSYEPHPEVPVFADRVDTYLVKRGNKEVGLLYIDDFQRPTKSDGAWMEAAQSQSRYRKEIRPIVGNALNLADSSEHPLMTMEEVVTAFHELGHGLHGLLSRARYTSQSGTNVPTDFVELPSQLLENWALEPSVLKSFARHHATGEPIPDEMLTRWKAASQFNEGFLKSEYLLAAYIDLRVHQLSPEAIETVDLDAFTNQVREELGCPASLESRYTLNAFAHIFENDYSASYYAYLWSEVLDADVFARFKEKDLFDPELAKSLRKNIYEVGHVRPAEESFEAFMGRGPDVTALMQRKGWLTAEPSPGVDEAPETTEPRRRRRMR